MHDLQSRSIKVCGMEAVSQQSSQPRKLLWRSLYAATFGPAPENVWSERRCLVRGTQRPHQGPWRLTPGET